MKHPIGKTSNNVPVYIDLIASKAAANIGSQPHLLNLVKEAIQRISARGPEVTVEHDMQQVIGYDFVVETTEKDTIVYAKVVRDDVYTRFAKNGKPQPTSYLTILLRRDANNHYELHDTWMGRLRPPRPGSPNETAEGNAYWAAHAFVLDNQQLQLKTVTKVSPY